MKAPFPWFGGKRRVAHLVWNAFGNPANYVEPFAGSLAVLLERPHTPKVETVNDLDCYLANFWRAVKFAPAEVAHWADWPVNEADLHARHRWLVAQAEFRESMRRDPHHFDPKIAGWWVWGICQWIGGGFCATSNWDQAVNRVRGTKTAEERRRPNLSNGNGVHRQRSLGRVSEWEKRPRLAKGGAGVHRTTREVPEQIPQLGGDSGAAGRGVHASGLTAKWERANAGRNGRGVNAKLPKMDRGTDSRLQGPIYDWMEVLSARLRKVRVCCGDWKRVLGKPATTSIGTTAVLLDPPYGEAAGRDPSLYAEESRTVAADVRAWCLKHGDDPKFRIALCGYEGEHEMPKSWRVMRWKAAGGYAAAAGNTENSERERVWFSPFCERPEDQASLFEVSA